MGAGRPPRRLASSPGRRINGASGRSNHHAFSRITLSSGLSDRRRQAKRSRDRHGGVRCSDRVIHHRTAIFRQINKDRAAAHHDALEFPDGEVVLLTLLCEGQQATVLQLPAEPKTAIEFEVIAVMCGRVIQSSAPIRYAIVDAT